RRRATGSTRPRCSAGPGCRTRRSPSWPPAGRSGRWRRRRATRRRLGRRRGSDLVDAPRPYVNTRDSVHLIELPLGASRTVNAVLVEGDPLTLVDTGVRTPESLAALERALAARGRRIEELDQIVITHPHHDHFGAAAALAERSGAVVVG